MFNVINKVHCDLKYNDIIPECLWVTLGENK